MKKKFLPLLLALSMLLSLYPPALAAEEGEAAGDIRETHFFTPQEHADVDYSDMAYEHIDIEPLLEEIEAVKALAADKSRAAEVEKRYDALTEGEFTRLAQMNALMTIRTSQDVTDVEAAAELVYLTEAIATVQDELSLLTQAILKSPCSGFLRAEMCKEDIAFFLGYTAMAEEEKQAQVRRTELNNEFSSLAVKKYACEIDGREYTEQSLVEAFASGEISQEQAIDGLTELTLDRSGDAAQIYLELVEIYQKIAKSAGYDNYAEYAYPEYFGREYTPREIKEFKDAVKEYLAPVYAKLYTIRNSLDLSALDAADYTGDAAFDAIEPYIGKMSSEMLESFTYMRSHHLYDMSASGTKDAGAYTTVIPVYNAPFIFSSPSRTFADLSTAVHEFGHYNNFFWQEEGLDSGGDKDMDSCEVHSQGLELLFTHWYPDLIGGYAQDELYAQMFDLVDAIIAGSTVDDVEQFVYSSGGELSVEKINEVCLESATAYNLLPPDSNMDNGYLKAFYSTCWSTIPHNFSSPCYYISYAVSAAGAFAFWLEAQEDYFSAVDKYLEFTALDTSYGFEDAFAAVGMDSPLSVEYIKDLAEALDEELELDARVAKIQAHRDALEYAEMTAAALSDVPQDAWYAPYVLTLATLGAIGPQEDGTFSPDAPATHGDVAQLLKFLNPELSGEGDGRPVTRLELCQLLSGALELEQIGDGSPFTDTSDPAVAALAGLGVVTGYGDGSFRPNSIVTRAELCAIIFRAVAAIALA